MNNQLSRTASSIIDMVSDKKLQQALIESFSESQESVRKIEDCFALLPTYHWSNQLLAIFFNSWKATHLKMLAIYGLSCRLQRLALTKATPEREKLFFASAYNAETSYEDLGLDFQGQTHAELYDNLVSFFLGNFPWQLEEYCLPKAREFKKWIYQNMVVDDISTGLLSNMFSEIYNHAEYTMALSAFSELVNNHYQCSSEEKDKALCYVQAHVADETEVAHFLVVVKALQEYTQATNTTIDYQQAKLLFKEYLNRVSLVMEELTVSLKQETDATRNLLYVS
ncbi:MULTISPECIES: hypothetical protein [unclassified Microcoleus]|uniref:hypothetical protein n=1 Tax=unclassified Microcoleus TaxID=2642155 RepID=UPI002FD20D9E